jgi:murein DD-endopeptidase MepM/ murein hydrolase activator NlpD
MRKVVLVFLLILLAVAGGMSACRVGPPPEISIETKAKAIGRKTPLTVKVSEPKRGLGQVRIELVQGEKTFPLADKTHQPSPWWKFWESGLAEETFALEVGREKIKDLKQGEATIRVTAERAGTLLRSPAPVLSTLTLPVRLTPPSIQLVSNFHYVNQGGCEAVLYRLGDTAIRDGVEAGGRFFPGWPLPGGGARDRFALFAVPYDMSDVAGVKLLAEDEAGNATRVSFIDEFFKKPLHRDTIQLNDAFMEKVVTEILGQTPELDDAGGLIENYLQINRELRKRNRATQAELAAASKGAFLWREPFQPMRNTAIMAHFADRRSYMYGGKSVDTQDHLGLDMASVKGDAVPAANDGVVVLARYFGIYGNAVVVDHGYGLQSLYGHLSSISVKEGDAVKRGQTVGRSGATGLAGGDHLHFEIALQGLAVSPIEWWDPKWLTDRLKRKLGGALPYGG